MADPIETAELLSFTKAVEMRSLSRAASQLGLPRATLGRRLARLEQRLGVRLLRRTTRSLALTDAGEAFYKHARIVLEAVTQAELSVKLDPAAVRGTLRVTVPPIEEPSFHAMLCDFAEKYPEVQLHFDFTTRFVDLHREGYDVAVRAGTTLEPGLVARTIARSPVIAFASPKYLAVHGTPRTVRDLKNHRCLLGFTRGQVPQNHWPLVAGGQVHVEGRFFASDIRVLITAAVRGLGLAALPQDMVARELKSGRLVHVLEGVVGGEARVSVVYPEREFMPPQVRAFIDDVLAWVQQGIAMDLRRRPPSERGDAPVKPVRPVSESRKVRARPSAAKSKRASPSRG
jgi:DNA-binding transcriptional LysR family regulator